MHPCFQCTDGSINHRQCKGGSLLTEKTPQEIIQPCSNSLNPLRAKLFKGNKNIYLHFMSFLHIDLTRVLKILPQVGAGSAYSI